MCFGRGFVFEICFNLIFGSDWTCFWCCSDLDFGVALTFVFVLVCIHFWLWFCTQIGVNLTGSFGLVLVLIFRFFASLV